MDGSGILIEARPAAAFACSAAPVGPANRPRRRTPGGALGAFVAVAVHGGLLAAILTARSEPSPLSPPPMQVELALPMPMASVEPPPSRPEAPPVSEHPPPESVRSPLAPAVPARARTPPLTTSTPASSSPVRLAPAPVTAAPERHVSVAKLPEPEPARPAVSPSPPPAPAVDPAALASFQGRVMARLAQVKRYPAAARARREQGTASVRFTLTGHGKVRGVALDRSSGSSLLDREALETVRRAQPLPSIPAELSDPLQLAVAVEFALP